MRSWLIIFVLFISYYSNGRQVEVVVQRGHNAAIKAIAFTNSGKYLLTGSRDKTMKLWEVETGRELITYFGHESTINDISVSGDDKFILTSSADKTARLWELKTGELIKTFTGHSDILTAVSFVPGQSQFISAGYDNEAFLWDIESSEIIRRFKVNPEKGLGYGINVDVSPDGKIAVFGNDNRAATIYDIATGEFLEEFKPEQGWCGGCATFVAYDNKGNLLKAGRGDELQLINLGKDTDHTTFISKVEEVNSVDLADNGLMLMTTEDSLFVFDKPLKRKFKIHADHELEITDAIFSPDGTMVATTSDDFTVTLRDAESGEKVKTIQGYLNEIDKAGLDYNPNSSWDYYIRKYTSLKNEFAISPNGKYLVTGKIGSIARMWELRTGVIKQEFRGHEKAVFCMAFSPDGSKLITGSADNTLKLWNVSTGEILRTYKGHREVIFSVEFSEDGKKFISGSWDGAVRIWDLGQEESIDVLRLEEASAYDSKFYKDQLYMLTALFDKTLKMWERDSKRQVREFIGHTDIIHRIDVNRNNKNQLASVSWDGSLRIWNVSNGLLEKKIEYDKSPLYALDYNNSGTQLAFGGVDRQISIINTATWQTEKVLIGHTGSVTDIAFNDDLLVSASDNGEIKIWDLNKGKELLSYLILNEQDWMAITPSGYFNSTQGAANAITFVKGLQSYKADQFFDQFYQPDLINKTFSESVKNKSLNLNEKIEKYPPPKVTIIAPHQSEKIRNSEVDLIAAIEDTGGGIDKVKVEQNGKTIYLASPEVNQGRVSLNQKLQLVPGKNQISVSAFSEGGIESDRELTHVTLEGKVDATLYLFAVGINKYRNQALNLNYAAADAQSFIETMKMGANSLFDRVEIIGLYDKEATQEEILSTLSTLAKVIRPQDVFAFYYAGHGSMVDNNFYFIPTENVRLYSADKLKKNAIEASKLQEKLKQIAALKQLVIIDACQSGGSVELLASRGAAEEKALAQLSRSTGIHVLAAAGSEQFAVEFKELGHGLFTYVLLEGLKGGADGAPKDGKVTIFELKSYIDDQVPELSRKYKNEMQFPYTFSRGQDFPISIK